MKHYAKMNGWETDHIVYRKHIKHNEDDTRNAKRIYRQRERAALKRMVEELVIEEMLYVK